MSFQEVEITDPEDPTNENTDPTPQATFTYIHANILVPKCLSCHNPNGVRPSEDFTDYNSTLNSGKVVAGNPQGSELYQEVASGAMPQPPLPDLSQEELDLIFQWISEGALND